MGAITWTETCVNLILKLQLHQTKNFTLLKEIKLSP